jgi:hypothetical protein
LLSTCIHALESTIRRTRPSLFFSPNVIPKVWLWLVIGKDVSIGVQSRSDVTPL